MHEIDLEKAQREEMRWRILKILDAGRPGKVPETLILSVLQDISLPATPASLRRELDYLRDRKLIDLQCEDCPIWSAELTRAGVDVVEYTVACEAGIARPKKWG
jgi:hypothetical protein